MRGLLRLLPAAVIFLLCVAGRCQGQVYRFKSYTSRTGLSGNTVYALLQDREGNIWFGTEGGACRYDGKDFTTFGVQQGLADTSVRGMVEDRQGRIWFMTGGGISRFDGKEFVTYTTAQGLPADFTYCGLVARDGAMWFGTIKGLSRFDGSRFVNYGTAQGVPDGPVWDVVQDRHGTIWLAIRGGGLVKFDGERFTAFHSKDGLANDHCFDLVEDPKGGLWITTDKGLCFFDGATFRTYTTADGLGDVRAGRVLFDRHGRLWCSTFGGGLCRLEGGRFMTFNLSSGLPNNYLTAILEDYEGNIWCGTNFSGAFRFSNELFARYSGMFSLGAGRVSGLGETADGTLWSSSLNDGMFALDPQGKIRRYGVKDGMLEEAIWKLYVDSKNRVWLGSQNGVSCFDGKRFQNFTREQLGANERITAIVEDRHGNMWFGSYPVTGNGIIRYDGKTFTRLTTEDGLLSNPVNTMSVDRAGNLWVCGDVGLCRYDGRGFTSYTTKDGIPGRRVVCLFEDRNGLKWIGTDGGLCSFDGRVFQTYSTNEGLAGNTIRAISEGNGLLWIGTNRGISSFDGKKFRNYTSRDGFLSDEVSFGACLARADGSVWFGTTDGVVRYKPALEIGGEAAPRLHIEGVYVHERGPSLFPPSGDDVAEVRPLRHFENGLTFEFVAPSFVDEEAVEYSFRLIGFDDEWSAARGERRARFTNLPPGTYRFEVKAVSAAGVWSAPKSVVLTIRPPFWQTWWFRLAAILTAAGSIFAVYAWRINDFRKREREKLAYLQQLQEERLDHVRKLQEERLKTLRQLLESIRVINSTLDLTAVLLKIAEEGARLIGAEPGSIGLVEDDFLVMRHVWNEGAWEECRLRFRLGEGVAGRVAATGTPLIVNDPKNSPYIVFPETLERFHVEGMMNLPIINRKGRVVGVLDVRRPHDHAEFTEEDCRLAESLTHQAAVAIENAGLYGQLEEKNLMIAESLRELEKLYRNEQDVSRRLQELNQMKNNFLVVTSHEMRTPLTVLKGYTEALSDELLGPLGPEQQRSLASCRKMIDRLTRSFNDILEMLRINEGQFILDLTPFDLGAVVDETVRELTPFVSRREQAVIVDAPDETRIVGDRERLKTVLLNVIQNAIKFTHNNGQIRIAVADEGENVHIRISDTGIGIEAVELDRIFDKFYTSRDASTHTSGEFEFSARGTGLGLAISKSYVEAHGGQMWAESDGPGRGSCFHVRLPKGIEDLDSKPSDETVGAATAP